MLGHMGGHNRDPRGFDVFPEARASYDQLPLTASQLEAQKTTLMTAAFCVPSDFTPEKAPVASDALLTQGVTSLHQDCLYSGQLLAGVPEGVGKALCPSAQEVEYEGHFAGGVYEGEGRLFFENEEEERGEFKKGVLARGRRILKDGSLFVGEFKDGLPDGQGRYVLPSGVFVEGQWEKGKPKGEVKVKVPTKAEEIVYDMAHPDDNTVITLRFCDSFLLFKDNAFDSQVVPTFLYFFNGDVFVGNTKYGKDPANGYYFCLANNKYTKLTLEGGCEGIGISDIEYSNDGLTQTIVFK